MTNIRTFSQRIISIDLSELRGAVQADNRNKRVRLLVKRLNKARKKQAKQIDILCNDLIGAQREFINKLKIINFKAFFYESIIGAYDLSKLLGTAAKLLNEEVSEVNIVFFLGHSDNYELFTFDSNPSKSIDKKYLENFFNSQLIDNIYALNKVCTIEEMYAMDLQRSVADLGNISGIAVPLFNAGLPFGIMFVYRSIGKKLKKNEIQTISAIACGLASGISISRTSENCPQQSN